MNKFIEIVIWTIGVFAVKFVFDQMVWGLTSEDALQVAFQIAVGFFVGALMFTNSKKNKE